MPYNHCLYSSSLWVGDQLNGALLTQFLQKVASVRLHLWRPSELQTFCARSLLRVGKWVTVPKELFSACRDQRVCESVWRGKTVSEKARHI